mmetsp:Transcript_2668/g.8726  ORF Transcript_2668/g.8726 Transcript_2668/m.8726 type:complete len:256 (+) Transcript_2668:893-1660(+)
MWRPPPPSASPRSACRTAASFRPHLAQSRPISPHLPSSRRTLGASASTCSLGPQDWGASGGTRGLDTVRDNACQLKHVPEFSTLRSPSAIEAFEIDGETYLMTASGGSDLEYGEVETAKKFKKLLVDVPGGRPEFHPNFQELTAPGGGADFSKITTAVRNFGGTSMRLSIGSTAVDYSNPQEPVWKRAVGSGSRSVSIYRASDLSLVWDSGEIVPRSSRDRPERWTWDSGSIIELEVNLGPSRGGARSRPPLSRA